jgi:hypothetical protein
MDEVLFIGSSNMSNKIRSQKHDATVYASYVSLKILEIMN